MIVTALENMHPLHSFDFLECRTANITRPKFVTAKLMYVRILHSVLTSVCVVTAPTSFTCCKARLDTDVLSFLCLHKRYIAKVVTISDITAVMNRKISTIYLLEKKYLLVVKSVILWNYHAFPSNQKFHSCDYTGE